MCRKMFDAAHAKALVGPKHVANAHDQHLICHAFLPYFGQESVFPSVAESETSLPGDPSDRKNVHLACFIQHIVFALYSFVCRVLQICKVIICYPFFWNIES
jgi:hypothetical protein